MDQPEHSGSSEPNTNGRKKNNKNDQHLDGNATTDVSDVQTADILKMDIDCCEEAFDYLPVKDLFSVGKTCKRMQQVAGYCFQQNYSYEIVHISKEGIYINISGIKHNVEHFAPFIQRISIEDEYGLRYFCETRSKYRRLKQIELRELKSSDMDRLKKISMSKLGVLRICNSELSNEFDEIVDQCVKLWSLEVFSCKSISNWLNRKYSTLENFAFYPEGDNYVEGIPAFLELNPNIRWFETNAVFFLEHRDAMLAAFNVKLDDLIIRDKNDRSVFKSICDLLDELHAQEFYKQLALLIFKKIDQEDIDRLASLNGLNQLVNIWDTSSFALSTLNNLEKLFVYKGNQITDIDNLPNTLINLKTIYLDTASFDAIMPFIRRSVEMQAITIVNLRAGVHFNEETGIINLPALNRERSLLTPEQLAGVQKVTLHVSEWIYLATKWAFGETDFGLVRLERCI